MFNSTDASSFVSSRTRWALLVVLCLLPIAAFAQDSALNVRLLLLGTKGGPALLTPKRLPQSSALLINNDIVMIDAGYGASARLVQAGKNLKNLRSIYLTHLHSDHVLDYPALLMNSWATGLDHTINVYGPPGTGAMTQGVWQTFKVDIDKRIKDEGKPDPRRLVNVHEIDEGEVSNGPQLKVSAQRVPHPPFKSGHAFAYKFQVAGKTIVFTGDLHTFPPGFTNFARNADIMVSEIVDAKAVKALSKRIGNGSKLAGAILSHHVSGKQVGQAASAAHVKKLVLSHLVPADDPSVTDQTWIGTVRGNYSGPVVVGQDGMRVDLDAPESSQSR